MSTSDIGRMPRSEERTRKASSALSKMKEPGMFLTVTTLAVLPDTLARSDTPVPAKLALVALAG